MSSDRHDDDDQRSLFFPNGRSSDVDSRILLIAIITLSAVVVVVTMLHVYVRYILRRRQARGRVVFQGLGLVAQITPDEPPKRGLEPMVIASLPILMYKDSDHGPDPSGPNPECAVCLSSFEDGQMIRVLPNCKHHFHVECIDKWLESQSSCPICRHEVELDSTISPLPREPSNRFGVGVGPPSAPPLEHTVSLRVTTEGTSDEMVQSSVKVNGTSTRLSSFRRMISMERSSQRNNSCTRDGVDDLERQ